MQEMSISALVVSARARVGAAPRTAKSSKSAKAAAASPAKRGLDLSASVLILCVAAPLLLAIALLVLVSQGRPILYRHSRIGRGGVSFDCLKFRTMRTDADAVLRSHCAKYPAAAAEWASAQKLKNDPRVTPLGQVMRKLSIDELPQLLNVVRGEMSLVGPRPIVEAEAVHYAGAIDLYKSVRPGLTGPWQVGGRSDASYAQRVQLDSDYVTNWSLARDLSILARTVPAVLATKGSY